MDPRSDGLRTGCQRADARRSKVRSSAISSPGRVAHRREDAVDLLPAALRGGPVLVRDDSDVRAFLDDRIFLGAIQQVFRGCRAVPHEPADVLLVFELLLPPARRPRDGDAIRKFQRSIPYSEDGKKPLLVWIRDSELMCSGQRRCGRSAEGRCRAFLSRSPRQIVSGTNEDSTLEKSGQ